MSSIAFAGMPGGSEVFLIFFVILLLFGAKKLPELSRSLGRSLGEFKKGKEDLDREIRAVRNDVQEVTEEALKDEKPKPAEPEPTEPDRS